MSFDLPVTVYYEDTDLAGIVYYANYLKFIERGRSTLVRRAGIDQVAMKEAGMVFAVRKVTAEYLAPAKLNDDLTVKTDIQPIKGVRMQFDQSVWRGETCLFTAAVEVVCLNEAGKPVRLPADMQQKLSDFGV